jgi:chemotaxis protein MotA
MVPALFMPGMHASKPNAGRHSRQHLDARCLMQAGTWRWPACRRQADDLLCGSIASHRQNSCAHDNPGQVDFAQRPKLPPNAWAKAPQLGSGAGGRGCGTMLADLASSRCAIRRGRREFGKVTDSIDSRQGLVFARAPMLGAAFGLALIASATIMGSDGLHALFGLGGLIIVFGGVTAVAFMSFRPDDVCVAMRSIVAMLKGAASGPDVDLWRDVEDIVGWSRVVYENGTRGLERSLRRNGTADPLLIYGLTVVVSDYAQDDVRAMMETAADSSYQRAYVPIEVLRAMASHAPAFGMVGTLVGVVSMLHSLTDDAAAIGSTLAVAFLSTLYGVLSARMIYMPAAARLEQQVEAWRLQSNLVTEGMVMLACKRSPAFIRDRLNAFLDPQARNDLAIISGVANPRAGATMLLSGNRQATPRRMLQVVK